MIRSVKKLAARKPIIKKKPTFLKLEKVFVCGKERVRYMTIPYAGSTHLAVGFSAFSATGTGPRYHYVDTLRKLPCNRLYILDDQGPRRRGCYYLGANRTESISRAVIALIQQEQTRLGATHCASFGSSKGGWAALWFGFKMSMELCVAGAPQIYVGSYLNQFFATKALVKFLTGGVTPSSVSYLDSLLLTAALQSTRSPMCCVHVSKKDSHWPLHVSKFLEILKQKGCDYKLDLANYPGHTNVCSYFRPYVFIRLREWISKPS